ncbi:tetratricopeptide repeat protein [Mitsuaria sp. 7]|uniref:tetratricopeptide repeat protein n=1 Tax=Mitsuaria sp. 7 TaxID=1658665 RepID=UPI0012F8D26D|nr:SEL1-like repeat protein [Mitsuaria sp. 7]
MKLDRRHLEIGCDDYARGRFKAAARNFSIAARYGNAEAQVNLANMYDLGEGVPVDVKLAVHYYRLAASKGLTQAAYNLFVLYRTRGNMRGARYWLQRARDLGDEDALNAQMDDRNTS